MADINEAAQDAPQIDRADLDALPEGERKETEAMLAEIANGGKPEAPADGGGKKDELDGGDAPADKKPEEEVPAAKPEEKKPEAPAPLKPEDKKPDGGPEARRDTTLVPAWKLKVAEDQAGKREADLKAEIERLQAGGKKLDTDGSKTDEEKVAIQNQKIAATAEKLGITPEEVKELVQSFLPTGDFKLPEDIAKKLGTLDTLTAEREVEVEAAKFNADFDRLVLPLIKAEYGDDVPPETVAKLKEDLKAKAYDPDYAKVPYSTIYKGTDEFRGVIPQKKKGAESGRGGTFGADAAAAAGKPEGAVDWAKLEQDATYELTDDQQRNLSDADFDRYSDLLGKRDDNARQRSNADKGR